MAKLETVFVTKIYRATLTGRAAKPLNADLKRTCLAIAAEDRAGQRWSKNHAYAGYTSYSSLNDLPLRASPFEELKHHLDRHVAAFARELDFDLGRKPLTLDSMWINILEPNGTHSGHIHPHSVVSGAYYVDIPKGASALKFEDPRLGLMMAAPSKRVVSSRENQRFIEVSPTPLTLVLWESWLRHEVPRNQSRTPRISISFNYA